MVKGVNKGSSWTTDPLLLKGSGVQVLVMSGPLVMWLGVGTRLWFQVQPEVKVLSSGHASAA